MKARQLKNISKPYKSGDKELLKILKYNDTISLINEFIKGKKYICPYCKNEFDNSYCDWWWHLDKICIIPEAGNKCTEECSKSVEQDGYELCIETNIKRKDVRYQLGGD